MIDDAPVGVADDATTSTSDTATTAKASAEPIAAVAAAATPSGSPKTVSNKVQSLVQRFSYSDVAKGVAKPIAKKTTPPKKAEASGVVCALRLTLVAAAHTGQREDV